MRRSSIIITALAGVLLSLLIAAVCDSSSTAGSPATLTPEVWLPFVSRPPGPTNPPAPTATPRPTNPPPPPTATNPPPPATTTTTPVEVPLLRFYEATAYGATITEVLTLSTVHFWQWPIYRHTASAWVFHPLDWPWPTGASVQRLTYIFDLARVGGRQVISASVLFDSASYVTAAGLPNVPAWVSQGEFTRPPDALQAFTGGQRGAEWPWCLELNYSGFSWCQKALLSIPVSQVDWSRDQLALFVRSGVEERPDVWAGDRIYLHRFGWGLEQVCPQPQNPTLIVEVAGR